MGPGRDGMADRRRVYSSEPVSYTHLTYVADFFRKMGFQEVERGELPLKVWKDCVRCPKFQCCDEIAVMRVLRPEYRRDFQQYRQSEDSPLIQLPVLRESDGG